MKLIVQIPASTRRPRSRKRCDILRHISELMRSNPRTDDGSTDRTSEIASSWVSSISSGTRPTSALPGPSVRPRSQNCAGCRHHRQHQRRQSILRRGHRKTRPTDPRRPGRRGGYDRQTSSIGHFSARQKMPQRFGSWTVRKFSAWMCRMVSGFCAISRRGDAAEYRLALQRHDQMLIQSAKHGIHQR